MDSWDLATVSQSIFCGFQTHTGSFLETPLVALRKLCSKYHVLYEPSWESSSGFS